MNIAQRIVRRAALAIMRAAGVQVPGLPEWSWGRPLPPDPFELDFPNAFKLVPDIYACISLIQATIAELPLRFYRGVGANRVEIQRTDGAALGRNVADLWALANPIDTGYELTEQIVGSLEISGNAYMLAETLNTRFVDELWVIPGQFCKPLPGPNRTVRGYQVEFLGSPKVIIPPELITHFRLFDPDGTGLGVSALRAAQLEYETQRDSHRWQREFFRRGGTVSGWFTVDRAIDNAERDRVTKELAKRFQGLNHAWNAIILPFGLKPVQGGLTHEQMKFVETQQLTTADILRIFKIPPVLLGVKEGGGLSDAGASTDMLLFWQNCIKPRCRRIQTTLNERFLTTARFGPGITCEFDFASVLPFQKVFLDQAQAYVTATGRPVMTAAEARDRLGLDELLDDTTLDQLVIPIGVSTQADLMNPTPVPPQLVPPANQQQQHSRARGDLRTVASASLLRHERIFRNGIVRLFRRQEQRAIDKMRAKLTRARITDLEDLLNDDEADRVLVRNLIRAIANSRGAEAIAQLGLELAFDLNRHAVQEFIAHKATRLVKQINETTRRRLNETLAQGVATDESLGELTARVREVFNDRRSNAATIARTETAGAYNFVSQEAWDQTGVVHGKEWLTAHDEHVRDSHVRAEALGPIPLSEPFRFEGQRGGMIFLQYPGDPTGPPEEVINCRCTLLPAMVHAGGEPATLALTNGRGALTFEEFAR